VAKKKKDNVEQELSSEEITEIEELTENLAPEDENPAEEQEESAESAEESDSLAAELETARQEARNSQELYLRSLADMDNLRKRTQREKEDIAKFGNENILREILPVIDNLERAIEHAETQGEDAGLLEGVQMTLSQFSSVLQKFGVEQVAAVGEQFDPAHHQAMGQVETDEVPANHVANELQKGYMLNSRLLRPAMVMVAKTPEQPPENEETPAPAEDSGE
jgi:molecular chaperone GrpE